MPRNKVPVGAYKEQDDDELMFDMEEEIADDSGSEYIPSDYGLDDESDDEPQPRRRRGRGVLTRARPTLTTAKFSDKDDSEDADYMPDVDDSEDYSDVSEESDTAEYDLSGNVARDGTLLEIPDDFPKVILRVLNMIQDQACRFSGQHILQVLIDFIEVTFTQIVKQDIAAFLALAPEHVQEDLAETIATIVHNCFKGIPPVSDLAEVINQRHNHQFSTLFHFMEDLPNEQLAAVLSRPFTTNILLHLAQHLHFFGHATQSGRFELALEVSGCGGNWYTLPRTMAEVDTFIASLPIIDPKTIDPNEVCGICRGTFVENACATTQEEKPETAMQLSCRHNYGPECLRTLLGPKPDGWEHTLCPLCRAEVFPDSRAYRLLRTGVLVDGKYVLQTIA